MSLCQLHICNVIILRVIPYLYHSHMHIFSCFSSYFIACVLKCLLHLILIVFFGWLILVHLLIYLSLLIFHYWLEHIDKCRFNHGLKSTHCLTHCRCLEPLDTAQLLTVANIITILFAGHFYFHLANACHICIIQYNHCCSIRYENKTFPTDPTAVTGMHGEPFCTCRHVQSVWGAVSYHQSDVWSHCKHPAASPGCVRLTSCRRLLLRSFGLRVYVTVSGRFCDISHWNSVSMDETWRAGGRNSSRHHKMYPPSEGSSCASVKTTATTTTAP